MCGWVGRLMGVSERKIGNFEGNGGEFKKKLNNWFFTSNKTSMNEFRVKPVLNSISNELRGN